MANTHTLLSDEGAGIHALEYLRGRHPEIPSVHYLDGGTLGFTLAGEIEDSDNLIVIDAAQLDASPGTVRCMTGEEMDRFLGKGMCSVHAVGLLDLMDIARLTGTFPRHRALIGIQPDIPGWDDAPSPPVSKAFPAGGSQILCRDRLVAGVAVRQRSRHCRRTGECPASIGDLAVLSGMYRLHGITDPK
jgi:hydrogenase maturation protease